MLARCRLPRYGAAWIALACEGQQHEFVPADEYEALRHGEEASDDDEDRPRSPSGGDCDGRDERWDAGCTDRSSDPNNCGASGVACVSGYCLLGSCLECRSHETSCSGACVDPRSDAEHCGACDAPCATNELCRAGRCVSESCGELIDCNGGCVDLNVDPRHCGACGEICAPELVCSDGGCGEECDEPLSRCDGLCVDLETDAFNCGSCGNDCARALAGGGSCASGVCEPSSEDCHNGVDDDDDGLRDCEDPTCEESHRCVPASPAGWSEPFVLFTSEGATAPSCAAPFANVVMSGLHEGLLAGAPECSCECTTTAECHVTVWFYDDSACLNEPWELSGENALASGTCESIYFEREGTDGAIAIWPEVSVEKEDAENTDCNIDSEPLSPPSWSLDAIGCGLDDPSSAGCGAGTCVARSNTTSYCVAQQGNQSCPEAFPEKRLMHTDFLDDRACGDCECDLECASSFRAYTDESCAVDEQSLSATQPCAPLSRDVTPELEAGLVWETRSFLVAAPSCEPTSSASGAAAPSGSVTVCCESEP